MRGFTVRYVETPITPRHYWWRPERVGAVSVQMIASSPDSTYRAVAIADSPADVERMRVALTQRHGLKELP